jgi:hypothetical protein
MSISDLKGLPSVFCRIKPAPSPPESRAFSPPPTDKETAWFGRIVLLVCQDILQRYFTDGRCRHDVFRPVGAWGICPPTGAGEGDLPRSLELPALGSQTRSLA